MVIEVRPRDRLSRARADWVLVFQNSRLVEEGHHDDLVRRDGVYAGLHRSWVDATSVVAAH